MPEYFEPRLCKGAVIGARLFSFTFTPDVGKSLAMLAASETSWNQTWHVPTATRPRTGREFIQLTATRFGVEARYRVFTPPMLKLVGVFNSDVRELGEMLYQHESPYLFDSTKFTKTFGFKPTAYADGIEEIASTYNARSGPMLSSKCE